MALGTTQATLEYIIKVQDRDLKDLKKQLKDTGTVAEQTSESHNKLGSAIGGMAKAAGIAAGAAGLAGLGIAAKVGFDEFNQGQKVAAQTAAVLKSTGGAANVTASQIDALANSLLRKTGIDDETTKSGENLLLTFTNIRNEVGQGNDIFTQTTKIMTDMSVALGQDTSSSAIQLGKALNDPIKGVTALQRVGVSFTADQKEQIKTLVESGKTMDAQKLILGELTKEFGGSAEAAGKTFSGQINVAKETLNNMAGEVVGKAMPSLQGLLTNFNNNLPAILAFVGGIGDKVGPVVREIFGWIRDNVFPILGSLKDIFVKTVQAIEKVVEDNRPAIEQIWKNLKTLMEGVKAVLQDVLLPVLQFVLATALPKAIGIALPIIAKLSDAWKFEGELIKGIAGFIGNVISKLDDLGDWIKKNAKGIASGFESGFNPVKNIFSDIFDFIDKIKDGVEWLLKKIPDIHIPSIHIPGFGDGVASIVNGQVVVPPGLGGTGPTDISSGLWDDIGLGRSLGLSITSGYRPGAITSTGNPSLHGVYPAKAVDMGGTEAEMRQFFLDEIGRPGIAELIHSPYWWHPGSGVQTIPPSAGSVLSDHYNHVHVGIFHNGGIVPGYAGQNVPAVLQAGEGVFTTDQMAALGGTNIYVNVEGSVIRENDLGELVYNYLLQKQTRMPLRLNG